MDYKNSAAVKIDDKTDLVITADLNGKVEKVINLANGTNYAYNELSNLGGDPVLIYTYESGKVYLKDTGFSSWTPSNTEASIVNTADLTSIDVDFDNYDYVLSMKFRSDLFYTADAAAYQLLNYFSYDRRMLTTEPNDYEELAADIATKKVGVGGRKMMEVYLNSSKQPTLGTTDIGIYPQNNQDISPAADPLVIKSPTIKVKCSSSYFSTAQAANVDQDTSYFEYKLELYRVDKFTSNRGAMIRSDMDIYKNGVI